MKSRQGVTVGRSRWRAGWFGSVGAIHPLLRHGLALAAAAVTVALKLTLDSAIKTQTPFWDFVLPLVLIAWFAGFGPSVVSALLIAIAAQYFPLSPNFSLALSPTAPAWLAVFLGESTVLCWLTSSRQHALKKLRTAEQLYRALAENIPQLTWIWSRAGRTRYANRRLLEYTGLRCQSLLSGGWEQAVHPDDRTATLARWVENLPTGEAFEVRQRLRRADGVYRWFLTRAVPVHDERGQMTDWFGTCTDIDNEVRAEEAHARLAAIVETANDAIISRTLDGVVTSWNAAAERIYGYSAAEMIGRSIVTLFPPEHKEELESISQQLARGERVERLEAVRVRKDGTVFSVSATISPIRDASGKIIGASAISRDITGRKRSEQALRESEQRFHTVADAAPVMIWMADARGQWTFRNKTCLEFMGNPPESEPGRLELVHEADREFYGETCSAALNDRRAYQVECRLKRADGQYRWVVESGVPHFAPDGALAGYIGSCVDVTERKWIEQSLRGAFAELETETAEKDRALAEATQRLRHEITKRMEAEKTLQHISRQN